MALFFAACQEQIDPRDIQSGRPPPDPNSPLVGTMWHWGDWGGTTLYFETPDTVIGNPGDPGESSFTYSYDKATHNGQVDTLGRFTVTPDYGKMNFSEWRHYGHGAEFTRIE